MNITALEEDIKVTVKKVIVKKAHFMLGITNNVGVIRMLKRKSNTFIILEDLNNKTIICKTAGSAGILGSKRKKKTSQATEIIFNALYPYIKIYKIEKVRIILNSRLNSCFYILLRCLEFYSINIIECCVERRIAFNGCKGSKLRRV